MAKNESYNDELKQTIIRLYNAGKKIQDLAKEYGLPESTVRYWAIPYSRFKKALAPSWMAAEISRILSDPSSFFKTERTRKNAKINPKMPEMTAINISSIFTPPCC